MVIMALAAILLFFAWPSLPLGSSESDERRATLALSNLLAQIRTEAVLSGRAQALRFNLSRQTIERLESRDPAVPSRWRTKNKMDVGSGIRLVSLEKGRRSFFAKSSNTHQIVCFPNGICESAILKLKYGTKKIALWVQPHLDQIKIDERPSKN